MKLYYVVMSRLSVCFYFDELTEGVVFFWLHITEFNFLYKSSLFSYFGPDVTITLLLYDFNEAQTIKTSFKCLSDAAVGGRSKNDLHSTVHTY